MRKLASKNIGFTLIELLITVVIVGILAAIAVPSYNQYVTQSRRSEAQTVLMELAMSQEKFRANYPSYGYLVSGTMALSDAAAVSGPYDTTYYRFAIGNLSATSYMITGEALGTQADRDAACKYIKLNQNNDKCAFSTDSACPATPATNNDVNKCWKS